jgi:rod shape-determining protein MreB
MILVCGATTTQIAVLSLGAIVSATTVPLGGDTIHHAVIQHLRNHHELILPSQAVRPLHVALTGNGETGQATEVWGRDVATGMARTVRIDPGDVRAAIEAPLIGLSDAIRGVLHNCPPDLVADLADRGMVLAGGSALLPGLDERLRAGTGMPVHIAENPALCAVKGLAAMVEGRVKPLGAEVH